MKQLKVGTTKEQRSEIRRKATQLGLKIFNDRGYTKVKTWEIFHPHFIPEMYFPQDFIEFVEEFLPEGSYEFYQAKTSWGLLQYRPALRIRHEVEL